MEQTAGINWDTGTWDDPFTPVNETQNDPVVYWSDEEKQRRENEANQQLVQEHTGSAFDEWVKSKGFNLTEDTKDFLYQWYASEQEQNSAWQKTLEMDSSKYQRAVQDMKKAGLNPFLLLSNGASSPNLSAANVQGGSYASRKNAQTQAAAQGIGSALGLIGAIIGACIIAMA